MSNSFFSQEALVRMTISQEESARRRREATHHFVVVEDGWGVHIVLDPKTGQKTVVQSGRVEE